MKDSQSNVVWVLDHFGRRDLLCCGVYGRAIVAIFDEIAA
jgi:hypothetical protein